MKGIKKIGFFTAFILPALVVVGFALGGYFNFLALVFAFVVLPVLDQLQGVDRTNLTDEEAVAVHDEYYYRFVTYVWTYVQLGFVVWGAYVVGAGLLTSVAEWVGFVLSFALVTGGIGITVAHELGHKKSAVERFYSKALLMTVCYMHFYIEHNRGHHVYVATPLDPATARKHENFYAFWIRSVVGGYLHAWRLERESLAKKGRSMWSVHNQMIHFFVLPFLLCGVLTALFSTTAWWAVPVFFFAQSIFAFTLLELVNYVEHYGIMRHEISPGRYERVNPLHSWNASHLLSNFFLFQLQRHSDHHAHAAKRYHVLKHYDQSPQLPFGYPTMILLALIPPVWFAMMNPRLQHWEQTVRQHNPLFT